MKELIREYKESLKKVQEAKLTANEEDQKILISIESDLRYAIRWMQTARRPGNRRGIERRSAYQREKPFDPILIQQYFSSLSKEERSSLRYDPYHLIDTDEDGRIGQEDRDRIEKALECLSSLEREVYLMSRGNCIPYRDIARMMRIKETTVASKIERAEKKLAQYRKKYSNPA